jgi:hypothetical protein
MEMFNNLMIAGGLFWALAYILIVIHGFKEKTFGMPVPALCLNISWEFVYSFIFPVDAPFLFVTLIWFFIDVVIFYQLLRFWQNEFPGLSGQMLLIGLSLLLLTSLGLVLCASIEFGISRGSAYVAFGSNLVMSMLFIIMLLRRNALRGQSIHIAILKLLGTSFVSAAFYLYSSISKGSILLQFLYVAITVCDAIYVTMIHQFSKGDACYALK